MYTDRAVAILKEYQMSEPNIDIKTLATVLITNQPSVDQRVNEFATELRQEFSRLGNLTRTSDREDQDLFEGRNIDALREQIPGQWIQALMFTEKVKKELSLSSPDNRQHLVSIFTALVADRP